MQTKGMPEGNEATNPQTRKGRHSQPKREKAKGISQMIAGAAVAAIGIPLCVLPGPGVAVIACGVALASKGQRTYSGRKPTKVERKLDAAEEKLGSAAKKEAGKIAKTAAREAPVVAEKAARAAGKGIAAAATAGRCCNPTPSTGTTSGGAIRSTKAILSVPPPVCGRMR